MKIGILSHSPDFAAYCCEILKTSGVNLVEILETRDGGPPDPRRHPVIICPAGIPTESSGVAEYLEKGGNVVTLLPDDALASKIGIVIAGEMELPVQIRFTDLRVPGLRGESLPVVGKAHAWTCPPEARVLAWFSHPARFEGESPAIIEMRAGSGRLVAVAFDLALAVLLFRQGDPSRGDRSLPAEGFARPCNMACDAGLLGNAWLPYSDLLGGVLLTLVRRLFPAPVPALWQLPGNAAGIVLYSGDEDVAKVADTDDEMEVVRDMGGRMNLYIIPENTKSTPVDLQRFREHHDLGPHPNLRPFDGRPVRERVEEFARQVRVFEAWSGCKAKTVRNHCTAWAGYLEIVERMEDLGIGMDTNYLSGAYLSGRVDGPYSGFGAALPMLFCRPDGRLIKVFPQHTHFMDDFHFGPTDYSYKWTPEQFEITFDRVLEDIVSRYHTPCAFCIHPGNWSRFSRPQGVEILRQATERKVPVWSFDQ